MRTGVFFQADDEAFSTDLLADLKRFGFAGSAYKLGSTWESLDGEELSFNFAGITHFILVPNGNSFKSRWLPFLAGFAMGGMKTMCLVLRNGLDGIPDYLSMAHCFRDVKSLGVFLEDEANIWDKTYQIERSREALIALGIGINEANLSQRVAAGDDEAVANFLQIGYSADTIEGGVPLIITATRNNHRKIIDLLLDHGADVNVISQDRGNTALMEAAVRGDESSVRRFLQGGANPDLQSKSGQTALMLAVGEGHKGVTKAILEFRPNSAMKDQLGMSARKYAELFHHEEIIASIDEYESTLVKL